MSTANIGRERLGCGDPGEVVEKERPEITRWVEVISLSVESIARRLDYVLTGVLVRCRAEAASRLDRADDPLDELLRGRSVRVYSDRQHLANTLHLPDLLTGKALQWVGAFYPESAEEPRQLVVAGATTGFEEACDGGDDLIGEHAGSLTVCQAVSRPRDHGP